MVSPNSADPNIEAPHPPAPIWYHLILQLLLLEEKECSKRVIIVSAPLQMERGWGEVNKRRKIL
jgi:hypothetical protein